MSVSEMWYLRKTRVEIVLHIVSVCESHRKFLRVDVLVRMAVGVSAFY